MDITPIAEQLHKALADIRQPVTVAVMGCVVNGPGEAETADVAICAGKDKAVLYRRGKRIGNVTTQEIVPAVVAEVHALLREKS